MVIYCDSFGYWVLQSGYTILGRYKTLKGARIAKSHYMRIEQCN